MDDNVKLGILTALPLIIAAIAALIWAIRRSKTDRRN